MIASAQRRTPNGDVRGSPFVVLRSTAVASCSCAAFQVDDELGRTLDRPFHQLLGSVYPTECEIPAVDAVLQRVFCLHSRCDRKFHEPGEIGRTKSTESFRDVFRRRCRRIANPVAKSEVLRRGRRRNECVHFELQLVGNLPHLEIFVSSRNSHERGSSHTVPDRRTTSGERRTTNDERRTSNRERRTTRIDESHPRK
jgi:hypothetical protein